jgi:molybdate transport system substrate-binding protein
VRRVALANPGCPLGRYTQAYLEHLGLYEKLAPAAVWAENSRAALAALRGGRAEVALVYASDAARADACRVLFRTGRTPSPIRYHGAVVTRGQQPGAARALLNYLGSPAAAAAFRRCGFSAAGSRAG